MVNISRFYKLITLDDVYIKFLNYKDIRFIDLCASLELNGYLII